MSVECQVNSKSQSELDIGGRETCLVYYNVFIQLAIKLLRYSHKLTDVHVCVPG